MKLSRQGLRVKERPPRKLAKSILADSIGRVSDTGDRIKSAFKSLDGGHLDENISGASLAGFPCEVTR